MTAPVVIPVREGRRSEPDHLRYVLRSLANLAHGGVVIAGHRPAFIDPTSVTHLPTVQGHRKFVNIGANLWAALDALDGVFYWFNDDMYLLESVNEVELFDKGPMGPQHEDLRKRRAAGAGHSTEYADYLRGMEGQRQILRQWGYDDDTPSFDLHVPMPVDVARCREVLDRVTATNPDHQHGHFRTLYGAGLPSTTIADPKPSSLTYDLGSHEAPWFSTHQRTWLRGLAARQIRDLFPDPSVYERN